MSHLINLRSEVQMFVSNCTPYFIEGINQKVENKFIRRIWTSTYSTYTNYERHRIKKTGVKGQALPKIMTVNIE
jgi:hypothetical protein